jgi:hypothetical protein
MPICKNINKMRIKNKSYGKKIVWPHFWNTVLHPCVAQLTKCFCEKNIRLKFSLKKIRPNFRKQTISKIEVIKKNY